MNVYSRLLFRLYLMTDVMLRLMYSVILLSDKSRWRESMNALCGILPLYLLKIKSGALWYKNNVQVLNTGYPSYLLLVACGCSVGTCFVVCDFFPTVLVTLTINHWSSVVIFCCFIRFRFSQSWLLLLKWLHKKRQHKHVVKPFRSLSIFVVRCCFESGLFVPFAFYY